jgi:hypothetical protein
MKAKTKTATKKKPAEKAPAKKDAPARDRWGNREGTQAATINACIGTKPKSIAALAKETEIRDGRIRDHVRWLLARGHVTTSEAGIKSK